MLYNLKEACVTVGNSTMDYAVFGYGSRPLVIIPGLSLRDVRGAGLGLAYTYRRFMREFRIYVIDKKNDVPQGYSVKDIADDTVAAMRSLGIDRADVYGVSLGGMVAQYIAVNYPEAVNRLILGVTTSRQNETIQRVVGGWISAIMPPSKRVRKRSSSVAISLGGRSEVNTICLFCEESSLNVWKSSSCTCVLFFKNCTSSIIKTSTLR